MVSARPMAKVMMERAKDIAMRTVRVADMIYLRDREACAGNSRGSHTRSYGFGSRMD